MILLDCGSCLHIQGLKFSIFYQCKLGKNRIDGNSPLLLLQVTSQDF